jgi:uncharacterized protein (TIGR02996 family)
VTDVAELEAQIRANPDDIAARLVYADWLQSQGDPFGELVMLQHQLETGPTTKTLKRRERAWLAQHVVLPRRCAVTWRLGFVRTLRVRTRTDVDPALRALLRGPACRFLHGLRVEGPYLGIVEVLRCAPPHLREFAGAGNQLPLDLLETALELQPELTALELDTPITWQRAPLALASPVLAELVVGHVATELTIDVDAPALRGFVASAQSFASRMLDTVLALPLVRVGLFASSVVEGLVIESRAWPTLEEVGLDWPDLFSPAVDRRLAHLGGRKLLPNVHWSRDTTYRVGQTLRVAKRFEDALRCFEQGIAMDADDVNMWLEHGVALARLGRIPESIASYERVLELAPRNYAAHYNLACHCRDTGDFKRGHRMIEVACELAPEEPAVWHIRGQLELRLGSSVARESLGRALELYAEAVAADALDANPRFQIACVHQLLGDRARCLTELAAAIAIDPRITDTARTDIDLVDLRDDPEYARLLR